MEYAKEVPSIQNIRYPIIGDIAWGIWSKKITNGSSKAWLVCLRELREIKKGWWMAAEFIFEGQLQFF